MPTHNKKTAILWLRRDLRLADNPALLAVLASHEQIIPLYIHADKEEHPWNPGEASLWWLHHSLKKLDQSLRERGSRLFVAKGTSIDRLNEYIALYKADTVVWNRVYEPGLIDRDIRIKNALKSSGIICHSFNASLLNEPHTIVTGTGSAYRVFTAYWRKCRGVVDSLSQPLSRPAAIQSPAPVHQVLSIADLQLLPTGAWHEKLHSHWQPGEAGAVRLMQKFIHHQISYYDNDRDIPGMDGTSKLSPHLHYGEISPRQLIWELLIQNSNGLLKQSGLEQYLNQIGWREFAYYLMYHFPHTVNKSLDSRFDQAGWVDSSEHSEFIERWQQGNTGIPIVDAGMRELWQTGWMHNRVRMIVASILTKNLGIHWLEGARWFWDTLVDADLACNTLGWQWTAGCGVDAAPYFRIFSPVRQTERFDAEGKYIKNWVPELKDVSTKILVTGLAVTDSKSGYPLPMIDLKTTRQQALQHWDEIRISEKAIA